MRLTFHLTPAERWAAADPDTPYDAPSLATEGFIHCTDGEAALLATANRHYGDDPRPFLALTLDLDAVGSPWRVEDTGGIYPHVFGTIHRPAILAVATARRDETGRFTGLDPLMI
jgi:uncharacterized protein (DUF952 family)